MLRDGSLTAVAGGTGQPFARRAFFWPIAKALSRLPPPLVSASIPGPRSRSRDAPGEVSYDSPPGRAGASFHGSCFPPSQVRRTNPTTPRGPREPSRAARERVRAAEHRSARAASVFKQRCDPKADGLLERPGEAFCPAKFIKLRLEGLAYGPDLALGAIAPVIDACSTPHQPRNPFARHHEARFQRRAEPRGRGFRTHRSPPAPRGSRIQKLYT